MASTDTPDYLQTMTEDQIRQRMLDRISDDYDKTEGGFIWDVGAAPQAVELNYMAFVAQETRRRGFASLVASTVPGEVTDELTMRAAEHGVIRKDPQPAKGTLTITGTAGKTIPAGFQVGTQSTKTADKIVFTLDSDALIGAGGTVDTTLTAVIAGKSGNVAANTITMLVDSSGDITSITNAAPMGSGADIEDDVSLLPRYLTKVRLPSTGGNKADYINWTLEVSGVGGVSVVPLRDGPGTVSVAIIDTEKNPAVQALIDAVQTYLLGKVPIGATVTVEAAGAVTIDVVATITVAAGYDPATVKAAAATAMGAYLKSLAFTVENDVRYVRVGQAILDTDGVLDYSNLTVNGGVANITVGDQEVAVLGTVTLT